AGIRPAERAVEPAIVAPVVRAAEVAEEGDLARRIAARELVVADRGEDAAIAEQRALDVEERLPVGGVLALTHHVAGVDEERPFGEDHLPHDGRVGRVIGAAVAVDEEAERGGWLGDGAARGPIVTGRGREMAFVADLSAVADPIVVR